MKQYTTILTTVVGALIIGFIFFTTGGVADNSKLIAVNSSHLNNVCENIKEIKTDMKEFKLDLKEIRNILVKKGNR